MFDADISSQKTIVNENAWYKDEQSTSSYIVKVDFVSNIVMLINSQMCFKSALFEMFIFY